MKLLEINYRKATKYELTSAVFKMETQCPIITYHTKWELFSRILGNLQVSIFLDFKVNYRSFHYLNNFNNCFIVWLILHISCFMNFGDSSIIFFSVLYWWKPEIWNYSLQLKITKPREIDLKTLNIRYGWTHDNKSFSTNGQNVNIILSMSSWYTWNKHIFIGLFQ